MHDRLFLILTLVISLLSLSEGQPARAEITPLGQQGCKTGTFVGGSNLVTNGDFAISPGPGPEVDEAAGFTSDLPNRGPGIYPSDPQGGFSIQNGPISYYSGQITGRPFAGDSLREVPAGQTYFYSNPNEAKDGTPGPFKGVLWRQTITNLAPGTTYNFFAYFDNLLNEGVPGSDPLIDLRVNGIAAGPAVRVPKTPDTWVMVQYSFTTGPAQTSAVLEIYDTTADTIGDDFGMTAINLKQCVSNVGLAKAAEPVVDNRDGTYTVRYKLTINNYGVDPLPISALQVTDNLSLTFAQAGSFQVEELSSPTLTVNPNYNGTSDTRLLSGTDILASSGKAEIFLSVRVTPGNGPGGYGPFQNSAALTALSGTIAIGDNSAPGDNPDPNGDGFPRDISEPPTAPEDGGESGGDDNAQPPEDAPTPIQLRYQSYAPLIYR